MNIFKKKVVYFVKYHNRSIHGHMLAERYIYLWNNKNTLLKSVIDEITEEEKVTIDSIEIF